MTEWISLFKEFHSQAVEGEYPASARALYTFFLGEINARYDQTYTLTYSERELSKLTGLAKTTLHDTVKYLSDRGWIKTHTSKNKQTKYYTINRPPSRPVAEQSPTDSENSILHVRDRLKDFKDFKEEEKKEKRVREKTDQLTTIFRNLDKNIRAEWIKANGEELNIGDAEDLIALQKKYGAAKVAEKIIRLRKSRQSKRISILYLETALDDKGEKNGENESYADISRRENSKRDTSWERNRQANFFDD